MNKQLLRWDADAWLALILGVLVASTIILQVAFMGVTTTKFGDDVIWHFTIPVFAWLCLGFVTSFFSA